MDHVPDPTDVGRLRRAVAGCYQTGYDAVREYQEVQKYAASHPDQGSQAVATAVDLPRSRVRPWLNGSKPDPARALDRLARHGWDDLAWTTAPFTGLNVLVAWIFAGGSINQAWIPRFAVNSDRERAVLDAACANANVEGTYRREAATDRSTEFDVGVDGSVLGRLLAVLGAPVGAKYPDRELRLPRYLEGAPYHTRLDFGRTYVLCRGTLRPDRPTSPIQLEEKRSPEFSRALKHSLTDLTADGWITGSATGGPLRLSARATALLWADPVFGEWPPV